MVIKSFSHWDSDRQLRRHTSMGVARCSMLRDAETFLTSGTSRLHMSAGSCQRFYTGQRHWDENTRATLTLIKKDNESSNNNNISLWGSGRPTTIKSMSCHGYGWIPDAKIWESSTQSNPWMPGCLVVWCLRYHQVHRCFPFSYQISAIAVLPSLYLSAYGSRYGSRG